MASSPMRRLRKTGILDQDDNLVTIPRLPSVAGSNKPPGWSRWSAAEKVEHFIVIADFQTRWGLRGAVPSAR
jgi:hypothetical protein